MQKASYNTFLKWRFGEEIKKCNLDPIIYIIHHEVGKNSITYCTIFSILYHPTFNFTTKTIINQNILMVNEAFATFRDGAKK